VHCAASGAVVQVSGAILHGGDLRQWLRDLEALHAKLTGVAELRNNEPDLRVRVELKDGRGTLRVEITPDLQRQEHRIDYDIDQSYLPELISGLHRLFARCPVRGQP
jgi:hypothetical protein